MCNNDFLPDKLANKLSQNYFVVFLFHGVIKKSKYKIRNYNKKHIEENLFSKCIKALSKIGNPLSMDEIVEHFKNKSKIPPKSFVITFDDGFENNISVAAPILYDFKVPATIYITTEFVDKNYMSWIDKIEFALENLSNKTIFLDWIGEEITLKSDKSKIFFLNLIRNYVKNSIDCDPNEFANQLCSQLGFSNIYSSEDPLDKKMNWNQVSSADQSELLCIGGHSHTHRILSFLNYNNLNYEIDTSLKLLKEKAGVSTVHYSYPEGLGHCYSKNVIDELKKRGIICCPTAIDGLNNLEDDLFELKRVMV